MFKRILIANRGEIACRIMQTARRLGIESVAVYSDADREALHVKLADAARHIGPATASESYLLGERILQAAQASGAEAIHPGYGFLSENADFARACEAAGVIFIGPSATAIEAMGSKAQAKGLMAEAGVPLIPGYHGSDQDDARLRSEAEAMGFPVLIKATAGGGGKGMRAVERGEDFDEALAAARRESLASFADDRMLIEKLLQRPRHVEVQVFCDTRGNGVYLAERDCSIQRRHQKVIEEAPAPGLSPQLRTRMGETAVAAAQAINYRGAGTVEFLLDADEQFFFMEMNTRLQVEHPVTEMITGLDLVEWQLRVAAGEALPRMQAQIAISGHAMEARIYAEDTAQGFLPSTGRIHYLRTPPEGADLRIDTGVIEGSQISPYYDPMIAKLIVHGSDREAARRGLLRALLDFHVAGPENNIDFLARIVGLDAFAEAELDTGFIERHGASLHPAPRAPQRRDLAGAALALRALHETSTAAADGDRFSPWKCVDGWRVNLPAAQHFTIRCEDREYLLMLSGSDPVFSLTGDDHSFTFRGTVHDGELILEVDGERHRGAFAAGPSQHHIFWDDGLFRFAEAVMELSGSEAAAGDASFAAPMHGTVVALLCEPGAKVAAGDPVIVIEAMKMEQTLRAPGPGRVIGFNCRPGDLVDRGTALVDFEAEG